MMIFEIECLRAICKKTDCIRANNVYHNYLFKLACLQYMVGRIFDHLCPDLFRYILCKVKTKEMGLKISCHLKSSITYQVGFNSDTQYIADIDY